MTNSVVTYDKPSFPDVPGFAKRVALIEVVDQDTYDLATTDIRYFVGIRDQWEEERVRRKTPIDQLAKQLQADFKPVIDGADRAVADIKAKQKAFLVAEDAKRRQAKAEADRIAAEAKAKAEKEAAKLEKAGKGDAAALVRDIAAVAQAVTVAPTVEKSAGTSTPRKWRGRVLDPAAFLAHVATHPEHHALVEILQGAIDRAINAAKGKLILPGVENYEDFDIRVTR